jgi:hypothetical protein
VVKRDGVLVFLGEPLGAGEGSRVRGVKYRARGDRPRRLDAPESCARRGLIGLVEYRAYEGRQVGAGSSVSRLPRETST